MDGELKKVAEQALSLKPNFAYTLKEIRGEMEQIFDTGFFSLAAPKAEDTRDGVKITVEVRSIKQRSVSPTTSSSSWGGYHSSVEPTAPLVPGRRDSGSQQPMQFATSMAGPRLH